MIVARTQRALRVTPAVSTRIFTNQHNYLRKFPLKPTPFRLLSSTMSEPQYKPETTGRYASTFKDTKGPGDARPTALQIIKDEGLEGKLGDKVVLITGTSSGIGIETAKAMAATGARLFLGVRNVKKGEEALKEILKDGHVELLEMDLNSLDSVSQRTSHTYFQRRFHSHSTT